MPDKTGPIKLKRYLNSIQESSLKVIFCEHFNGQSQIWNFSRHQHDTIELIYFLRGRADITSCEETLHLSVFELVVYPKGVAHQEHLVANIDQEIICLQLACSQTEAYQKSFKLADPDGDLKWIIRKIDQAYHSPDEQSPAIIESSLKLLLAFMKQQIELPVVPRLATLQSAIQFIQEHYAEHVTLQQIASAAFVSPSYLTRQFNKFYHVAPMHYLSLYRIEIARKLLTMTDRPVKDIAEMVGFLDAKHFAKTFQALTGVTPSHYRDEFRNQAPTDL